MKYLLKLSLLALFLESTSVCAINPAEGWYAGIMLGGSYTPKTEFNFVNPFTNTTQLATLNYSGFGNIAGQVGYRFWDQYRLEGQLLINSNPYDKLTIGNLVILSPKKSTGVRLKGSTNTGAFMINGFYDFFTPGCESGYAPYVGAGLGYAQFKNTLKLYSNEVQIGSALRTTNSSIAAQLILGAGYFLDDFTWFGLDLRYLTTKKVDSVRPTTSNTAIILPPVTVNARQQFASINLLFNGMFNCA